MSEEISLWALLFIMYLGVIWITILHKLQGIEKSLRSLRPTNDKNDSPSDIRDNLKPKGMDI